MKMYTTAQVEEYFHAMTEAGLVADSQAYQVMIKAVAHGG
jgi:hypothetical protein